MTNWRIHLAGLAILAASVATAVPSFTFAADEPVRHDRQELATIENLSSVFRNVAKVVEPSVVNITSTKRMEAQAPIDRDNLRRFFREFGDPDTPLPLPPGGGEGGMEAIGTGSGVVVDVQGDTAWIVTNNHVVADATDVKVTTYDNRTIDRVQVVGTDPNTDLAVLKVTASGLKPARWGDSGTLQKGDWVLAFGSPFGYVGSMSHGIVSALNRQAGILGQFGYENFIQVDAAINPGNSGGPIVNTQGQIVGISTAIASRSGGFQGIGFAIPSNQAQSIYRTLREEGRIVRGYLGVQIGDVSRLAEEARAAGYKGDNGVIVRGVLRNSPAAGDLQPGDIIVGMGDQKVADVNELRTRIAAVRPGNEVTLQVFRNGKTVPVQVEVGQQPGQQPVMARAGTDEPERQDAARTVGLRLADLTDEAMKRLNVTAKRGAVVTAVEPRSPAARAGIEQGDVITRIGDKEIGSADDAAKALSNVDLKQGVRIFIQSGEGSEYVFLRQE